MITTSYLLSLLGNTFDGFSKISMPDDLPERTMLVNIGPEVKNQPQGEYLYICTAEHTDKASQLPDNASVMICNYRGGHISIPDTIKGIFTSMSMAECINMLNVAVDRKNSALAELMQCAVEGESVSVLTTKVADTIKGDVMMLNADNEVLTSYVRYIHGMIEDAYTEDQDKQTRLKKLCDSASSGRPFEVSTLVNAKTQSTVLSVCYSLAGADSLTLLAEIGSDCPIDARAFLSEARQAVRISCTYRGNSIGQMGRHASAQHAWDLIMKSGHLYDDEVVRMLRTLPHPIENGGSLAIIYFPDNQNLPFAYMISMIRNSYPDVNVAIENNSLVLIFGNGMFFNGKRDMSFENDQRILSILEKFNGFLIYGNHTTHSNRFREVYMLSDQALRIAMCIPRKSVKRVFFYEDYIQYCLIEMASRTYLNSDPGSDLIFLVHPAAATLRKHDIRNNDDLCNFMYQYLMNERSLRLTAEKLHMHRNTAANKLEKIMSMIDMDLEDPRIRLRMIVSLQSMMVFNIIYPKRENRSVITG